ncbi:NADH:ubiquinone oxidoreductase 24 kD subunit [Anaerohalosphaera lusitana]|uniref:NADH:ubiquinone oxidoreductase 24 kD subunit n=1 Tax=Anaerohalosphaera lusitana TaxID=1936003 RepID=A0A1U9NN78_9BACT|nr:(2Fe-2S) ferredoxin domain-containing protein [Anaerohalosphaera lusitana]AQT68976.1 NADH:ubiquinone oxidoreductase 24 kD subunit [Anaerohalosphaera lusitana]
MEKVKVEICTGTTCYVMGASEVAGLEELLDEKLRPAVQIKGSPCFGLCKDLQYRGAPYVKVNDVLIEEATVEDVVREIKKQLDT